MSNKRILITGASSGIGLSLAEQVSKGGHQVSVDIIQIDFSVWSSVVAGVDQLIQNKSIFDIVIFNAGTLFPKEQRTSDGVETCFQVNVLGHMYLADALIKCRPLCHPMHFVCVSSVLFKLCGGSWPRWKLPKEADEWEAVFRPRSRSGWRAYALSKFAITLLASSLNRVDGVTAVAVNPGNAITNVSRNIPVRHRRFLAVFRKTLISVEEAAANVVRACHHPLPEGQFYDQSKTSSLPKALTSERNMYNLNYLSQQLMLNIKQETNHYD
ncbi:hypothetical protein KIN20_014074 [Parelaphostrongylus tenuis]|uniref:Uncharacterized protein n=1 Tax=Parelaphostrongylus tenuis TaxID=148309 RepID=A0AAD5MD30_PARTN|nr:hypothetical protein KIN20_014074 [Parelaphostrongylus tenuis]